MSIVANIVEQTTTSTGTGNLTLAAVDARQTCASAIGTGSSNTFAYFIMHESADEWERGTGYMSDSTTLVRSTVHESSNADAAVNFSAGTKRVTNAMPADELTNKMRPVADRTALKAINPSVYTTAFLKEAGRSGVFVWDGSDLSTEVAADPQEGLYVSSGDGSSGAWVREGAIAGKWFAASWFGIFPADSGAATAINNAITTIGQAGGGTLVFGPYEYYITDTITRTEHNVFLEGSGHSWHSNISPSASTRWTQFGGTIWKWTAASASKMLIMRPATGASEPALVGGGMDGIILDANGVASHCLEVLSLRGGIFPSIFAADAVTANIHFGVVNSGDIAATEPRDMQHCQFGRILSRSWLTAALSADGIVIDGDDAADVSVCQFNEIEFIHKDGVGLDIYSSDACTFGTVFGFRIPGGTGDGVAINGGASSTDYPRRHTFQFVQPGPGGLNQIANTVYPLHNAILVYSNGNGTPDPTVAENTSLQICAFDDGSVSRLQANGEQPVYQLMRADAITSGNLGDIVAYGWDDAGNQDAMARLRAYCVSNTSTNEVGRWYVSTMNAGNFADRGYFGLGIAWPATMQDKGAGTINIGTSYYHNDIEFMDSSRRLWANRKVTTSTGATLAATDSGKLFNNSGAGSLATFYLPTAVAGMTFTFTNVTANHIDVVAASGAAIRIGTSVSSTNRKATSTAVGDVLTITAIGVTAWIAESYIGSWTLS